LSQIWSFYGLMDHISVIPFWIQLFLDPSSSGILRFLQMMRITRIIRSYRLLSLSQTAIQRQAFVILLTLVTLIFVSSSVIQLYETHILQISNIQLHTAVYMTIISVTTVGYGDITPMSN